MGLHGLVRSGISISLGFLHGWVEHGYETQDMMTAL